MAGLDGKESNSYYCPKCGARLSNSMSDFEVTSILQMLNNPDASRNMLEEKKKKYPNMIWPNQWAADGNASALVGDAASGINESQLALMTEYDFADAIEALLQKARKPLPSDEVRRLIIGERGYDDISSKYELGEIKAEEAGIYRLEMIGGTYHYIPPKDSEEQLDFSYQYKAKDGSSQYEEKGYFQEAIRLIQEEGPIGVEVIMDKLVEAFPDINSVNPYSSEGCAAMAAEYLVRINKAKIDEHGLCSPVSAYQEEEAFIEEYKEKIETRTVDAMTHRKEKTVLRVLDFVENHPGSTVLEIANGAGVEINLVKGAISRLKKNGELKCVGDGDAAKWRKTEISEAELRERVHKTILEKEREVKSDSSFGDAFTIMDVKKILVTAGDYISSEDIVEKLPVTALWGNQPVYEALYILQVFGEATNKKRDGVSYWCIRDEKTERKKRIDAYWAKHCDEYNALLLEQKDLSEKKNAVEIESKKLQDEVTESNIRHTKKTEEEEALEALQSRITVLKEELSSLGFFKGKEKKKIQEQVDELSREEVLKQQNAKKARSAVDATEQEIQRKLGEQIENLSKEITAYNNRLAEIEKELTEDRID